MSTSTSDLNRQLEEAGDAAFPLHGETSSAHVQHRQNRKSRSRDEDCTEEELWAEMEQGLDAAFGIVQGAATVQPARRQRRQQSRDAPAQQRAAALQEGEHTDLAPDECCEEGSDAAAAEEEALDHELHVVAEQLHKDIKQLKHPAAGPNSADFAEYAAYAAGLEAVPGEQPCCVDGCENSAVLLCLHCDWGGAPLCAEHDNMYHPHAHMHERQAIVGFPHKQALRPSQFHSAGQWEDKQLFVPPGPEMECRCTEPQWAVGDKALQSAQKLILITSHGRLDFARPEFECLTCNTKHVQGWRDFQRQGYHPASLDPRNCTFVEEKELRQLRAMQRHALPTFRGRAATIDSVGQLTYNQLHTVHVDPSTLSAAYRLYRRRQHFKECCEGQERWRCPVCAEYMHSGHADGNMKLWIYKSANKISRESCYKADQGAIFVADSDVDAVLQLLGRGSRGMGQDKLSGRSSFSAAGDRAARSTGRDISGRFITSCSHQLVVSMLNMPSKHGGERYAYAYIMAAELYKRNAQVFFGDLVCKWWPWMHAVVDRFEALQLEDPEGLASLNLPAHMLLTKEKLNKMTPATPVVHNYAHVWYCGAEYGPLHQKGVGNEAGETTELVNSYFSSLAPAVRHMSDGRSTDFITEQAWDWNAGKIEDLADYLCKRFALARQQLKAADTGWEAQCKLVQELRGFQLAIADVEEMGREVLAAATAARQRAQLQLSPEAEYGKLLMCIQETRALTDLLGCYEPVDRALSSAAAAEAQAVVERLQKRLPYFLKEFNRLKTQLHQFASFGSGHEQQSIDNTVQPQQQQAEGQGLGGTVGVDRVAADVLRVIQQLPQQLSSVASLDSARHPEQVMQQLLLLAQNVALAHTKMHHWAAIADRPEQQASWRSQLAEFRLQECEDQLEVSYLQLAKWQNKQAAGGLSSKEIKALNERSTGLRSTMKKAVDKYNLLRPLGSTHRPVALTEAATVKGDFPWAFQTIHASPGVRTLKEKKQIWDVYCRLLRSREQVEKAKDDIRGFAQYYKNRLEWLDGVEAGVLEPLGGSVLGSFADRTGVQAGLSALLAKGRVRVDRQRQRAQALLQAVQIA